MSHAHTTPLSHTHLGHMHTHAPLSHPHMPLCHMHILLPITHTHYHIIDQATVIWYKGASVLTSEVITPLSASSTFSLSSVTLSDGGLYQCMALNHLGCSHAEISVTISEPSGIVAVYKSPGSNTCGHTDSPVASVGGGKRNYRRVGRLYM